MSDIAPPPLHGHMNAPFVDWTVDHEQRLIQVTVRLDLWLVGHEQYDENVPGQHDWLPGKMGTLFKQVEQKWTGKLKCYDFKLKIDWRTVKSVNAGDVRENALDVRISDGRNSFGVTNMVRHPRTAGDSLSETPADQLEAERDIGNTSLEETTVWPSSFNTISHEVGHILGLEEGYFMDKTWWDSVTGQDGTPTPVPGHPDDVMQNPTSPVLPSTITKIVRRQYGHALEDQMRCPIALRSGPSELNLLMASISDVRLEAKTDRYDPPTNDPAAPSEPSTFTGTFHAAGEYLAQLGLPISASGDLDRAVSFPLDLSREPIDLRIDLGFWVLKQRLAWDSVAGLPYADGALLIEVKDTTVDSSRFWPGPPLLAEFYDPDKKVPTA
jgi:hypothetical protein